MKQKFPLWCLCVSFVMAQLQRDASSYDSALAHILHKLERVTLCKPASEITDWSCDVCGADMTNVSVVQDPKRDLLSILGANHTRKTIMVAFRGSQSLRNWIVDFEFWAQQGAYPGCSECRVHKGFYEGYSAGLGPLLRQPLTALMKQYPDYSFTVMGHSLGAALAAHHVLDLVANFTLKTNVFLYTMGEPGVGNAAFMRLFESNTALGQRWRIVNQRDVVPHLPPRSWLLDYSQWGPEVWYEKTVDIKPKICLNGTDRTCSQSLPFYDLTPLDHCPYLGKSICKCGA